MNSNSIYVAQEPGVVNAAAIYQAWLSGEKRYLSAEEIQTVWVRVYNLEAAMEKCPDHLVEGISEELEGLRGLLKSVLK